MTPAERSVDSEGASLKKFLKSVGRRLLYRPRGLKMGRNSVIRRPRWVMNPAQIVIGESTRIGRYAVLAAITEYAGIRLDGKIRIGNNVYIGGWVQIHAINVVEIGDGSVLSEHIFLTDSAHGFDPEGPPIMQQPLQSKGPVILGKGCFLGFGATVMPGVTLGNNCIVGARAVVTRSFPSYSVVAGNPARLIKKYSPSEKQWVSAGSTS